MSFGSRLLLSPSANFLRPKNVTSIILNKSVVLLVQKHKYNRKTVHELSIIKVTLRSKHGKIATILNVRFRTTVQPVWKAIYRWSEEDLCLPFCLPGRYLISHFALIWLVDAFGRSRPAGIFTHQSHLTRSCAASHYTLILLPSLCYCSRNLLNSREALSCNNQCFVIEG